MDPIAIALAATPTLVARSFDVLERLGTRGDAHRQLLRMLYLEARLNREVLESAKLGDDRGVPTTHPSFRTLPPLLETDAHVAALLSFAELKAAARPQKNASALDRLGGFLSKPYPAAVQTRLEQLEAEGSAAAKKGKRRGIDGTTPLKSIAFVCIKTAALQKLVSLPRNAAPAVREHRYAYRLEQILMHEQELLRQISTYPELEGLSR